ncbi:hypothetical protein BJX66DRAFT_340978 [Aspergillus keveii]|uniref:Uncharacterized protein n=1 Tax=Aspergillus keveii TaxID=714993 RepID=A0ABR4FWM3_9EURO
MADIDIPRFKLYFWTGTPPSTLLWRPGIANNIHIQHIKEMETLAPRLLDLTMCGSRVTSLDGSVSTLACLVEIDSEVHGLTVAHAFSHLVSRVPGQDQEQQNICSPGASDNSPSEVCFEDDAFVEDDVEYDIPEDGNTIDLDTHASAFNLEPDIINEDLRLEEQGNTSAVLIMEPASPDIPDLDWALIKMSVEESKKPNFYLAANNEQKPILLHTIAQHHPGQERQVLIIRTLQDPRPGTLLSGSSFIGGITRAGQCEVWNIAFAGAHGLVKGDSGSLVVDRETSEIYGYVIGLNAFGEAYVMPMTATLAQIKESLGADRAMLPNPYSLVRNMTKNPALASTSSLSWCYLEQALNDQESTITAAETAPTDPEFDRNSALSSPSPCPPFADLNTALERVSSYPLVNEDTTTHSFSNPYQPPPEFGPFQSRLIQEEEIVVFAETSPNQWQLRDWDLDIILNEQNINVAVFALRDFDMRQYRHYFHEMVDANVSSHNSGDFHCEYTVADTGAITPRVSWSCFAIKQVQDIYNYRWEQPCIHVDWDYDSGRQIVFVFDFLHRRTNLELASSFLDRVSDFEARMVNPFVWHRIFARDMYDRYSDAMWRLRHIVREQEKRRNDSANEETAFAALQDLARHCYNQSELVEVAEHTLNALVEQHRHWRQEEAETFRSRNSMVAWLKIQQGLLFEARRAHSLRVRSKTLSERLLNEINLASNLVSQASGQAASESATMIKCIAFLATVYLPGVYVSGIFGTSFFSFQSNGASNVSSDFWIFWAATVPLTVLTLLVWWAWHNYDRLHAYFRRISGTTSEAKAKTATKSLLISTPEQGAPDSNEDPFTWMTSPRFGRDDTQSWSINLRGYRRGKARIVRQGSV